MSTNHYLFGDTDLALARLDRLADAYESSSRRFLREVRPLIATPHPRVLDLGSGPGRTVDLLATMLAPADLAGCDMSERYIDVARRRVATSANPRTRRARMDVADITATLPEGPFDVIYGRHVLAHLVDPAVTLRLAAAALAPGGVIAIEETARLQSRCPRFARYYALVEEIQRAHGQRTFVGGTLREIAERAGLRTVDAHVRPLAIPATTMAALHVANLAAWGTQPYAQQHFDRAELDDLRAYLDAVAAGRVPAPDVDAALGQAILSS